MKCTRFLLIGAILLVSQFLFSQNHYKYYQDGLVVFQLKQTSKSIPSVKKQVDFKNDPLFTDYLNRFSIIEVKQLHAEIQDKNLSRVYQIQLSNITEVDEVAALLNKHIDIEYAELKELHYSSLTPDDPSFSNPTQWGLFRISAEQAWDISTGNPNVIVASVDNAIQTNHPDLQNILVEGYDATTGSDNPYPCGTNTGSHGTHVSGIIGAETNNGTGVASIGYGIRVMPVKIGNCNGDLTAAYEGVIWAANHGADIINMSWGSLTSSQYGQEVVTYVWNKGSILVAASGNDNSFSTMYPAGYDHVIAVAATNSNDKKAWFSNYSPEINISAPGQQIRSTNSGSNYSYKSGTSMAAPMVSGLLGLMKSYALSATNTELIDCLLNTADALPDDANYTSGNMGEGLINALNALNCLSSLHFDYDVAVIEIISPQESFCNANIQPSIRIKNLGAVDLTSALITYDFGGVNQTYNWSGSLAPGESGTVVLNSHTLLDGSYSFTVSASLPNGATDENITNNSLSSSFSVNALGEEITLHLITDCWGIETSWEIKDDINDNVVASSESYFNTSGGESYSYSLCLPAGCYTFKISDAFGDGLSASQNNYCLVDGYYEILSNDGIPLVSMTAPDANFGFSASHSFCLNNLINDAGIVKVEAPSTVGCTPDIAPIVALKNYGTSPLNTVTIHYKIDNGSWETYHWTGSLSSRETQMVILPEVSFNQGVQDFTVKTSLPNGNADENPVNDEIVIPVAIHTTAYSLPFIESFETDISNRWAIENFDGGITWERTTIGGTVPGNHAMKIDFYNYRQPNRRDAFISPKINLTNATDAELSFQHAYRRFDHVVNDSLTIYVSTDCGTSWSRVFAQAENGAGTLATQDSLTTAFTPSTSNEWCQGSYGADCFTVDLDDFIGNEVFIKFESYNSGLTNNNLFIDNINITGTVTPLSAAPVPNFDVNLSEICAGETAFFTDASTNTPHTWEWAFQGGDPATSTDENPVVNYPFPGTYDVTLKATNDFGSETIVFSNSILVKPCALPITLQSFSVNCSDEGAYIKWETQSELNSDYFTVERSRDGMQWESIATIKASGFSSELKVYEFVERQPIEGYYRLSQTDYNGDTETFDPIYSHCKILKNLLNVYPNPSFGSFTIELNSQKKLGDSKIVILDITGKQVAFKKVSVEVGTSRVYFKDLLLNPGLYLILVKDRDEFIPIKLIVNK